MAKYHRQEAAQPEEPSDAQYERCDGEAVCSGSVDTGLFMSALGGGAWTFETIPSPLACQADSRAQPAGGAALVWGGTAQGASDAGACELAGDGGAAHGDE